MRTMLVVRVKYKCGCRESLKFYEGRFPDLRIVAHIKKTAREKQCRRCMLKDYEHFKFSGDLKDILTQALTLGIGQIPVAKLVLYFQERLGDEEYRRTYYRIVRQLEKISGWKIFRDPSRTSYVRYIGDVPKEVRCI